MGCGVKRYAAPPSLKKPPGGIKKGAGMRKKNPPPGIKKFPPKPRKIFCTG